MTEQRSKGWLAKRKDRLTASTCAAAIDLHSFKKKDELMRDMVREHHLGDDDAEKFTGNIATDWGSSNEFEVMMAFEEETGLKGQAIGFVEYEDWLGASPDLDIVGENSLAEFKAPFGIRNDENPKFKSIDDQPHYFVQVQIQMFCTNTDKVYFYQWTPNGTSLEVVERDDAWLDENIPKLKAFHDEFKAIIADESLSAPYLEDAEVDMSGNDYWTDAEDRYLQAVEELDQAKEKAEAAKQILLELADGRKCVSDKVTVFKTEREGSISYANALKKLCPDVNPKTDLEEYRGKPSIYWTIKVKK